MNVVEPGSAGASMVARARSLLLHPLETWEVIDTEEATIEGLYKTWVAPLAAIPVVCRAIHELGLGGDRMVGVRYHASVVGVLVQGLLSYGLTLVSIYVLALVIDGMALHFGGERSRTQAFKLGAYSATAGWLAGLFLLLGAIGGLIAALGGLYSAYLLYLGLPKLMRSDPERSLLYFVAVLVGAILLMAVIAALANCVGDVGGPISIL